MSSVAEWSGWRTDRFLAVHVRAVAWSLALKGRCTEGAECALADQVAADCVPVQLGRVVGDAIMLPPT